MATQIIYSEEFSRHDNSGHPENAERLLVMMNEIKKTPFYKELEFIKPEILPEKTLYEIHSKRMIEEVKNISDEGGSWIDMEESTSLRRRREC